MGSCRAGAPGEGTDPLEYRNAARRGTHREATCPLMIPDEHLHQLDGGRGFHGACEAGKVVGDAQALQ